ncbi:MAG: DUF4258 domain-containing protein [Kiritimatiellia bacterium]|jgi:hypothetical protein|nr:DUF4258 domain-containing protein [Kiritimatiellia bacterium]MDP6810556.1 DUF4258 domain-containing protein [Kiritimatiellia bacterium]MDP7024474.1 DUF4258 domain-containing protein [Kiritimatiellia bacterium]
MAQILFSRHAKRRMRLYKISQDDVAGMLPSTDTLGRQAITRRLTEHKYPIKVVYEVQNESTVVITAYPVKKGKQ